MFRLHGCLSIHLYLSRPTSLPSVGKYSCTNLGMSEPFICVHLHIQSACLTFVFFFFVSRPCNVYPATNPNNFSFAPSQFLFHVALFQSNPDACVGALLSLLPYVVSALSSCNVYVYYSCVALFYVFVISFEIKRYETKGALTGDRGGSKR